MKEESTLYKIAKWIVPMLLSVIVATGIVLLSLRFGFYQYGNEIDVELYKIDAVKSALERGGLYPLYVGEWHNGYEMFRYISPLPYVFIGLLTGISGISYATSISVFYGVMVFAALMGFFLFGIRYKKLMAAFFAGLAFLFMPVTLYAAVSLGRLDIFMALSLMPGTLFWVFSFLEFERRRALLPFTISMILLVASHYVLAIVFGCVLLVYLFFHILARKSWKFQTALLGNMLLIYFTMGYFLCTAISGDILDKVYIMDGRWEFTVGYAMIITCVIALFLCDKTRIAGILVAIMGVVISLGVFGDTLKLIPYSALQNEYWYIAIATLILLVTLLHWKRLRTIMVFLFMVGVVIEALPVLDTLREYVTSDAKEDTLISDYLIDEAILITDSRLALMDNSELGAKPYRYMALNGVRSSFGADKSNALTLRNQNSLNEAFMDGFYDYMFDRLRLYGNDVVVVLKECLEGEAGYNILVQAAADRKYNVYKENDKVLVFKADEIDSAYGVITKYNNLAIGQTANLIAYIYPSFGIGDRYCLEDYKIDELMEYERLYLSGFTYKNKERAENMLRELSSRGVKIFIDMQHIPINELTGKNEFMGAYAQFIQFTEDFPILENNSGDEFKLDFQTITDTTWNTVYVSGCDNVLKEATYEGRRHLAYLACDRESEVIFMGFNLVYYYLTAHKTELKQFLDDTMDFSGEVYPESEIVPIDIEYSLDNIKVYTEANGVNCNLANVDTLVPDRIVSVQENMWVVNQGETVFDIEYPNKTEGIFFSVFGVVGIVLLWILVYVVLEPVDDKSKNYITKERIL